ncbi:MAG: aspartate/glutamate racemase family protein [Gammaproteobacteria bacterium]|nr:aspartate/glutamate racemase family protein [Gammaproteobacteria bacterium]
MSTNFQLGILGGMGPFATTSFLDYFYEKQASYTRIEQEYTNVIVSILPEMPDRTESLFNGNEKVLLKHLKAALQALEKVGVDSILVLCFTMHHLVPLLPVKLRNKIISLVDLTLLEVINVKKKTLLLSTFATYTLEIFEKSKFWGEAQPYIKKPDRCDIKIIHKIIYDIKQNQQNIAGNEYWKTIMQKYEVESFTMGCTDFFVLFNQKIAGIPGRQRLINPIDALLNYLDKTKVNLREVV